MIFGISVGSLYWMSHAHHRSLNDVDESSSIYAMQAYTVQMCITAVVSLFATGDIFVGANCCDDRFTAGAGVLYP